MSIPLRLASSFGAHALVALVGFASVPLYLALMGQDGYGLVGFHVALQTWVALLDMGLPTVMARRLSVWRVSRNSDDIAPFIKSVERIFWFLAAIAMLAIAGASPWIAKYWLGSTELKSADVVASLRLMAALIALRWMASLYQAALVGVERQNFVNIVTVAFMLLRTAVAIGALLFVSRSPKTYFTVHLLGTLCEVVLLRWGLVRAVPWQRAASIDLRTVARDLKLAGGAIVLTVVWLSVGQIDKIVLSHTMPLRDFGLFCIVSAICTGLAMLVPAFTQAVQPRMTALLAQQRRAEFVRLYRLSTALLLALSASVAGTVATLPAVTLHAWTGGAAQSWNVAAVLCVYAAGTGLANMLLAPFLLQYAFGNIRVQVTAYAVLGAGWIPTALWAASTHGPWGAGLAWLGGNVALLSVCWAGAHALLLSQQERKGMYRSIFAQVLVLAAAMALVRAMMPAAAGRVGAFAELALAAATILSVGLLASGDLRFYGLRWHARLRLKI